ncbi:ABC transporter ATP-binding protein [Lignipirellula cremea]|uniref:Multidrug export ATP-binding/permease protein n=1 Tax=Lignipirellula cremea TaxID=2528010 RepID=A0A518E1E2_9BACT|nr:ABC transporter ATP-binding protein [Lignipirellula cremea]QDU97883.1 Putative multidrug export ATP-binding/permease protein [Lignipirellula cremea]
MRNFVRVLKIALRFRLTLIAAVTCSFMVAGLWGANIGAVYPFVEVVFQGDSMHQWVDERTVESRQSIVDLKKQVADLRQADANNSPAELSLLETRLEAEEASLQGLLWLTPYIKGYLPDDAFATLVLMVVFLMGATAVKGVLLVMNLCLVGRVAQLTTLELRTQFFNRTLDMPLSSFGQDRTSELMSRMSGDVNTIGVGVSQLFTKTIGEPLKMLVCFAGAAFISWRLLLFSLLIAPPAMFLMYRLSGSIKRANRRAMEEMARLYGRLSETFVGITAVKAFSTEGFEKNRFRETALSLFRKQLLIVWYSSFVRVNNEIFGVGVICLAILSGGYLVLTGETHLFGLPMTARPLSFGSLMVFYAFLVGVSDPARKLNEVFNQLQAANAASDRLFEMLDREPTIVDPAEPQPLTSARKEIVFENVTFGYDETAPILHNVNLRIRNGETLAIVGPNGCGKSTLTKLLTRFYDPQQGSVRLENLDLTQVRQHDLRSRIGMVTQNALLFDESIAFNIRYGSPEATDEQVIAAAKKAYAHEFILETEEGYATCVGEQGKRLSGGQQQRVSLARAILRDPDILILDEATSQIDIKSEQLIHEALKNFIVDRTTIMITHRQTTLSLADRVLVMDAGRIHDIGAHDELLARCDIYRRLMHFELKKAA